MGSEKHRAGILAGCASSRTPGDWPSAIPDLGDFRGGQPFGRCIVCAPDEHPARAGTFVNYGGRPICKQHAQTLATGQGLPFVAEALRRATASEPEGTRGVPRMQAGIDGPCAGTGRPITQPQPRVP